MPSKRKKPSPATHKRKRKTRSDKGKKRRGKAPRTQKSAEDRERMWLAWQEKQTPNYVSRKCGISYQTVKRYRELDRWDERILKLQERAAKKADDLEVLDRARRIHMQRKVTAAIYDKVYDEKSGRLRVEATLQDLDRALDRLEKLEGDPVGYTFVRDLVQTFVIAVQVNVDNPEARNRIRTEVLRVLHSGEGTPGVGIEPD